MNKLTLPDKIGLICTSLIVVLFLLAAVSQFIGGIWGLQAGRLLFQLEIALSNPLAVYRDHSTAFLILVLINASILIGLVAYPVVGIHGMSFRQAWEVSAGRWLRAVIPMLALINVLVFVYLVSG